MKPGKFDGKMPIETIDFYVNLTFARNTIHGMTLKKQIFALRARKKPGSIARATEVSHVTNEGLVAHLRQRYGIDGQTAPFRSQLR